MSAAAVALAATCVSAAVYGAMMATFAGALRRRSARRLDGVARAPRVSILKPLAGHDDDLDRNLDSFARIDYPAFEILLGVAAASDPAYAAARRFVARHPRLEARVVVTDPNAATNPKVAQLLGLSRRATGDVYVVSDSNVRVSPGYLWSLVVELDDERVGMVTSLFAGTGEATLGAALENLQICAFTAPGIAALDAVGERLTVGKSMAVRRRDLARLGGFGPVGHVLAEDHALGRRFRGAGFELRTSFGLVENRNVACSIARTIERHTRWAKMRRSLHPFAFVLEPLLTPIAIASLGLVAAPCRLTASALVVAALGQSACALGAVRALRGDVLAWRYALLEVVRSYVTLACWAGACASRRIRWRGHPFVLRRGTVITPAAARGATRERAVA